MNRLDRGLALRAHDELQNARMPEIRADATPHVVSKASLGAYIVENREENPPPKASLKTEMA